MSVTYGVHFSDLAFHVGLNQLALDLYMWLPTRPLVELLMSRKV